MEPVPWLRQRPLIADGLLALALTVVNVTLAGSSEVDSAYLSDLQWWHWALVLIIPASVALRRTNPLAALGIVVPTTMLSWASGLPEMGVAQTIVLYSVIVHGTHRRSRQLAIGAAVTLILWTIVGTLNGEDFYIVPVVSLFSASAVMFGVHTASRHDRMIEIEARAAQAERQRLADEQHIVTQERARIARELHDVVAHGLSVIVVQAGAGRRVIDSDIDGARTSLEQVEKAARTALGEMRQVLGLLRSEDSAPWRPAPGLAGLDELIEDYRRGGLQTSLAVDGDLDQLPTTVDMSAYRIIEEALTNALKHGGPSVEAHVQVTVNSHTLSLEVMDNGRGAAAPNLHADGSQGHGLRGMQERVDVLSGSLRTGPRPGGGFEVRVRLPLKIAQPTASQP